MTIHGVLGADGFDIDQLRRDQVRYGVVVDLPFRLRVGSLTKIPMPDEGDDVWIHNAIQIPGGISPHDVLALPPVSPEGRDRGPTLWSKAVLIIRSPVVEDEAVGEIKAGNVRTLTRNMFAAVEVLNEVIYGYATVTRTMFGGAPLRFLGIEDICQGRIRKEFAFLAPSDYSITRDDVQKILGWRPAREVRVGTQLHGDLGDLPGDATSGIRCEVARLRAHPYHELAFRAKMAMISHQPMVALVLACAALEGAHAEVVREGLSGPLAQSNKTDGLVNDLLREQGISTLLKITPYLFLNDEQRPTQPEIDACLEAITMRNGIMHAKQKKGRYAIRCYTAKQLSDAYEAVMKVYGRLSDALATGAS